MNAAITKAKAVANVNPCSVPSVVDSASWLRVTGGRTVKPTGSCAAISACAASTLRDSSSTICTLSIRSFDLKRLWARVSEV